MLCAGPSAAVDVGCRGHLWCVLQQPARPAGPSCKLGEPSCLGQLETWWLLLLASCDADCRTDLHCVNVCATATLLLPQDLSAHVLYRLTRARLMAGILAFSDTVADNAKYRGALKSELALMQEEYRTLLYGGRMRLQV